jgi:hypothetical protein
MSPSRRDIIIIIIIICGTSSRPSSTLWYPVDGMQLFWRHTGTMAKNAGWKKKRRRREEEEEEEEKERRKMPGLPLGNATTDTQNDSQRFVCRLSRGRQRDGRSRETDEDDLCLSDLSVIYLSLFFFLSLYSFFSTR